MPSHQSGIFSLLLLVQFRTTEGLYQKAILVINGLRLGGGGEDAEEPGVGFVGKDVAVKEGGECVYAGRTADAGEYWGGEGCECKLGFFVGYAG